MKRSITWLVGSIFTSMIMLWGLFILVSTLAHAATSHISADMNDPVTIVYWHQHGSGDRAEFMEQLVNEFNDTNPYSITVQGEYAGGYGEIYDRVIDGLQNGDPLPNVVVSYPNAFADFARYGSVRFLDDYLDDPAIGITDTADYYPGVLDYYRLGEYGNQMAGLQHGRSIEVMYYNADLLAAKGLTIPTTWEAFETACISITTETVSGTIPNIDASRFATWLWSRGGELLSDDLNFARFQEQPGIESMLLFQTLINDNQARLPYAKYEDQGAFGNGQVGFTFGSSSGIPYYRACMENGANDEWGVTHVPAVPGNEVVNSYGAGLGVLNHTEDENRAAWIFIKWLTGRDQTARWAGASGYFPVRISSETHISMTEKLASDPQYAQAFDLLPLGRSEPGNRGYNTIRSLISDAMIDILQNGADVTITLQIAADEVDLFLAESGPDSAVIPPTGGTLVYTNTLGTYAEVQFPAGALVFTQTVSFVPLNDLPTDGLAFALVPNLTFSLPVTITIQYTDEDILGMDESALKLYNYDWSSNSWVDSDPCGGYVRDPINNILKTAVCHFSDYGMIDWTNKVYLPLAINGSE